MQKNNNNNKEQIIEYPQNLNTYLGQKGYTILKIELPIKTLLHLKEQLMIKPYIPGSPVQTQKMFPAYRESDKKIYVPRYFGEQYFGTAKNNKISEGDDISLSFDGQLRENQIPVVQKYLEHVKDGKGGLLELPCGFGKCLAKGTRIMLSNGNIENVENIKVGDLLMGDDSTPRKVLSLARGREQMYRIVGNINHGGKYVCNESHILSLKYLHNIKYEAKYDSIIDISVKDYLNLPKENRDKLYGYKVPIYFEKKQISLDPYLFGFWIGSEHETPLETNETKISISQENDSYSFIKENNLLKNKHIPHDYKCNSNDIQLKVLAGIIDANSYFKETYYGYQIKFDLQYNNLADDIVFLCRCLGFLSYSKNCYENNIIYIYISGNELEEIPLCIKRKITKPNKIKNSLLYKINVEKLEEDEYYGFEIDENKRFVLADFTVTHNTSISLYLLSQLKKKTLVIVHKEFLMNQWVERIQQFLPNAKIGKIQGQIIDIEGKDIVLGMLQSLSMKDYPSSLFDSFGFTIIDEVHHISSEVFSCALFKLVTKYMLGLSATMNRKDGTTKVFKMFLGKVVYKQERSKDEEVIVRGITYQTQDDEFNSLEVDFRGNTALAKMIGKICEYSYRSEFILKVLQDMLKENPKQQIMMISQYKNILKYMFDAIKHRNIGSVGYYVGGMKEQFLKETETKQIVLATYNMASEGLDIKTLSTLFMITPMTNIEQSVGRILRQKHDFAPIVVDIIDSHENFQKQWCKRKRFYKSQNYKIIQTNSMKYDSDVNTWNVTNSPNCGKKVSKIVKKESTQTINSRNSSERSIADDTESESESESELETELEQNKDKLASGVCLLKIKK